MSEAIEQLKELEARLRDNEERGKLHGQDCDNDRAQIRQRIENVEKALGTALVPGMTGRLITIEAILDNIGDDLKEIKESAQWTRRHLLTVAGALGAAVIVAVVNYILSAAKNVSGGSTTR